MKDRVNGIIYMLISSLSFSLMTACGKFTKDVPLAEKLFIRYCFAVLITVLLIVKSGEKIKGVKKFLLVFRSIIGLIGAFCYFYAVNYLPLGDATLLNKVGPFFTIILSALFLNEKMQKHHVPVLLLGLIGAGLVLKPGFHYNITAGILGLISAVLAGLSYTIIRYLRNTDSPLVILFYFSAVPVIVTIPLMLLGSFKIPTTEEVFGLAAMGFFTAIAQLCINNAYRCAPAGDLSVFDYTTILFSVLIGIIAWNEIPDILSITGGCLIISAGIINYRLGKKQEHNLSSHIHV